MQTAQVRPWLPGTSASGLEKGMAIFFGAILLVVYVPIMLLQVIWSGIPGGHLPWPALQWVLTTPPGALLFTALCILVIGAPFVLFSVSQFRQQVAQAIDITDWPPIAWSIPWPTRPQPPSLARWLGYGRREQALSLIMLVLSTLLAVALVVGFFASAILSRRGFGDVYVQCGTNGARCPPDFPVMGIPSASLFAAFVLLYLARARWLRRVEATSHVWLRYRDWSWPSPLCYVRQPGVTPEAVAAVRARFSSAQGVPLARLIGIAGLVITPYVLLVSASWALSAWLQLQWMLG